MLAERKNATYILLGAAAVFIILMGALLYAGMEEADYIDSPLPTSTSTSPVDVTPSVGVTTTP
jgi:hypothetical protein